MCEVSDEHPRRRKPNASEEGDGEHKAIAFAKGTPQRVGAEQPHAGPQGEDEGVVLHTARYPLCPEPHFMRARVRRHVMMLLCKILLDSVMRFVRSQNRVGDISVCALFCCNKPSRGPLG